MGMRVKRLDPEEQKAFWARDLDRFVDVQACACHIVGINPIDMQRLVNAHAGLPKTEFVNLFHPDDRDLIRLFMRFVDEVVDGIRAGKLKTIADYN